MNNARWSLLALTLFSWPACALAAPDDITGVWLTDDGAGAVEITPCGVDRCGRIVWLKQTQTPQGEPVADANNPNASLRARPVCGLRVLSGLKLQSDGGWDGGRVYDPEEGKTYDAAVRREGADRLKVTGYIGVKTFGETVIWTRAPKALSGCSRRD